VILLVNEKVEVLLSMRTRRDKSEIIAGIDEKIAYHEELIKRLMVKRERLFLPPTRIVRKTSMSKALSAVKEAGLTPDEIMALVEKKKRARNASD
jgi:hypothetical protein